VLAAGRRVTDQLFEQGPEVLGRVIVREVRERLQRSRAERRIAPSQKCEALVVWLSADEEHVPVFPIGAALNPEKRE
jgi:hypothetical protein